MRVLKDWLVQSALPQALPSGSEYLTALTAKLYYNNAGMMYPISLLGAHHF